MRVAVRTCTQKGRFMLECLIISLSLIMVVLFLWLIRNRINHRLPFALWQIVFVSVLLVGCASTNSTKVQVLIENNETEKSSDENTMMNNQNKLRTTNSMQENGTSEKYTFEIIHLENGTIDETVEVVSENEITVVKNAIFDYLIRSAAWPGTDIEELSDCYQINWIHENGSISEYYTYMIDNTSVMQYGKDGHYSAIGIKCYNNIVDLFNKALEKDEEI